MPKEAKQQTYTNGDSGVLPGEGSELDSHAYLKHFSSTNLNHGGY